MGTSGRGGERASRGFLDGDAGGAVGGAGVGCRESEGGGEGPQRFFLLRGWRGGWVNGGGESGRFQLQRGT